MYFQIIRQCALHLKCADNWLTKAEQYAATKKFDVGVLLNSRLAPDQHPFIYQIQSACDYVKGGAAWLSGHELPKHPDTEATIAELRARIHKTVAFVDSIPRVQYENAANRRVTLSWKPGKAMVGLDYLLEMTLPNTYFHLTTAYSILRHNGIRVGKMDFLGAITFHDA